MTCWKCIWNSKE